MIYIDLYTSCNSLENIMLIHYPGLIKGNQHKDRFENEGVESSFHNLDAGVLAEFLRDMEEKGIELDYTLRVVGNGRVIDYKELKKIASFI